jgi:nitrate reductase gamma subunit
VRRGDGLSVANTLFVIVIPYASLTIFVIGFIYRIVFWARSPVPFHIPTVCGQQKSLPWIKGSKIESPVSMWGVFGRMALEVLLFRSLFRNDRAELVGAKKAIYRTNLFLWLGGLIFHWSLLIILLRHVKLFFEPVPGFVTFLQSLDGLFQISSPALFVTDILIVISLCCLVFRRISNPQIRYISLFSDYLSLALIFGTVISGILMRHIYRVDLLEVKRFTLGILSFCPIAPKGMGAIFYVHLFLVCTLLAYFPFSKLMHMGGVFMSPTRNLKNNSRAHRHINSWSYPVKTHTYEEWENEFRDAIKEAGLPMESDK